MPTILNITNYNNHFDLITFFETNKAASIVIILIFAIIIMKILVTPLCAFWKFTNDSSVVPLTNINDNFRAIYFDNVKQKRYEKLIKFYSSKPLSGGGKIREQEYDMNQMLLSILYENPTDAVNVYIKRPFIYKTSVYEPRSKLNYRNKTLKFNIELKNSTATLKGELDNFASKIIGKCQHLHPKHTWLNYQSRKEKVSGFVIISNLSINTVNDQKNKTYFDYIKELVDAYNAKSLNYTIIVEQIRLNTIIVNDTSFKRLLDYFTKCAKKNSGQLLIGKLIKSKLNKHCSVFKFNDDLLVEHIVSTSPHFIENKSYSCDFFYSNIDDFDDFSNTVKEEILNDYEYKEFSTHDLKYLKIVENKKISKHFRDVYEDRFTYEITDDSIKICCTKEAFKLIIDFLKERLTKVVEQDYQLDSTYALNETFFKKNGTKFCINNIEIECKVIISVDMHIDAVNDFTDLDNFGKVRQMNVVVPNIRNNINIKIKSDSIENINMAKNKLDELIENDKKFSVKLSNSYLKNMSEIEVRMITSQYNVNAKMVNGELILTGPKDFVKTAIDKISKTSINKTIDTIESLKPRFPEEWDDMKEEDGFAIIEVIKNKDEYKSIYKRIAETISNPKIKKIERIQNKQLWELYMGKVNILKKKGVELNEEFLFHGTSNIDPLKIYKGEHGFQLQSAGRGLWGHGIYFAVNASYSKKYYAYKNRNKNTSSILCAKVALGDYIELPKNETLTLPPKKNEEGNKSPENRYDSVKGNDAGSDIFIVYENSKAYPQYLVTFSD